MPDIPEMNENMDQNPWSLSYLQSSTPHEEPLNNYGGDNPDSLLMSSCQGLPPATSTVEQPSTPILQNSNYEALISPTLEPTKDFFADALFNGVCKENQSAIHNFVQNSSSQNENTSFSSDATYTGPVPSISFNSSERRSPGPFGVLPHEAVLTRSTPRYQDRNNDKFISPVSKSASASYNNGPYTDRDSASIYSSAPLSAQSAFSGDTASLSPVVNSVTSPSIVSSFSSPSEYYSSPKTNVGAYNSLQSPVPQSPSVAQHSYPSSPFGNVDPVGHISSATPCSPMSAGTYVNNLNAVPQRNGQMSQPSPSNSAANGNLMCFSTPQTPSMVNHGPQSVLPKPSDYHSEYGFPHDHNSQSSYSSLYPAIHSTPMSSANSSRMPHRTPMQHQNMQQDGRMPYPHSASQSSANTNYMQNNICHDGYGAPCNVPTGQSMHPPQYPCATPMNNNNHNMVHTNSSAMMSNQMGSDRSYSYGSNCMDDKKPVNLFNPHLDSSVHHNHSAPPNHSSYMNHDVSHLDANMHPCRQLNRQMDHPNDPHKLNYMTADNSNRGMMSHISMGRERNREDMQPTYNMNFSYGSSVPRRRSRNLFLNTPRRRGRRGRRRKSEIGSMTRYQSFKTERMYDNYSMAPAFLDYGNVETQSAYPKRMCDEKELPPMNYPFSRYRSELKMNMNVSEKKSSDEITKSRKIMTVEEEVGFLEHLTFPEEDERGSPHTFMKTRNKDCDGFLQCYRNFLVNRKSSSDSDPDAASELSLKSKTEHHAPKENEEKRCYKPIPKLIFGRSNNPGGWKLKHPHASPENRSDSDESASESSGELISSHKIKQEYDSEEENSRLLKLTGKFNKLSHHVSKHSAKRKNDSNDHSDKYYDKDKRFSNYETLSAGRLQIKTEIEEPPNIPKKRGRKKKSPTAKGEIKQKTYSKSAVNDTPIKIKQEIIEDDEIVIECQRRSTRSLSKRCDTSSQDPEAGPSIKKEQAELSSDDIDIIDDSDSDPAWTPTAKTLKVGDHIKAHPIPTPVKKRGPKPGRRSSAGNGPTLKVKKEKAQEKTPTSSRKRKSHSKSLSCMQETVCIPEKVKKERVCGRFLVAKADIEKPTPYLWLVDTETNMLQRFEWYEQQGIVLYRSTYTYAAWNEISFANYVKAKVKVVSHSRILHVVEYLGPELTVEIEKKVISGNSVEAKLPANPLRENFEVFLQTLISQALDPSFLSEITNENDEYFLNNIKEIESVSQEKKKPLVKDFWEEALRKCADTYPYVNILGSLSDDETCEVCKKEGASKLLQFYGQPYDWTTLGSVDMILANKTQYTVCVICSATVSLYSRLHHQKYNFFTKCRAKMNDVKSEGSKMESHVLLETCLQDHTWVNTLFAELEQMWRECDEKS